MFCQFQKLISILLSGIVAFIGGPIALAATPTEVGDSVEINGQIWKTAPQEAKIGNNEIIEKGNQEFQLTKEQLEEIEKLASESYKIRKQMIDKYVEYGVISKERGDKIKESMDKHFERMKEHNFTPFLHKIKKAKKCNCKDNK